MFSGMLLEGNSFKDGWQSLWKSIAQIAIKQLLEVWLFKKVLNLGSWFSGGMAEGGSVMDRATGAGGVAEGWNGNILDWPKPHKDGGLIGFATGGYTDGLIKGAGTGTSDSILTYLAHRGQFIKTSNGEYIVKKDSVDKMGVPFLDALNNNPEIVEKMKHYASGGSLGTEMIPTMKNTTVDSYYRYNSNKVLAQNQNKRLEELMLQQNELISSMGKGNDSGKVIVLNTQADSVSVMKAIQKNPRAIQKLLGHQQSHGFRG